MDFYLYFYNMDFYFCEKFESHRIYTVVECIYFTCWKLVSKSDILFNMKMKMQECQAETVYVLFTKSWRSK